MSDGNKQDENKEDENNPNGINFLCPISLEPYKEPVFIPDCGHTFDRQNLVDLPNKKCPICSIPFSGNPNNFKINWSLASIMNLNVKIPETKPENDLLEYSAKDARYDKLQFINEIKSTMLIQIMKQVKQAATQGKSTIDYDFSGIEFGIIGILKQELIKKGFTLADIYMKYNSIRLNW